MKKLFALLYKGKGNSDGVSAREKEKIYALQRSEILDECTCKLCISMDGLVLAVNDKIASIDLFCKDCRGIWVEIMKEEVDPPPITGVPDELRKHFNSS